MAHGGTLVVTTELKNHDKVPYGDEEFCKMLEKSIWISPTGRHLDIVGNNYKVAQYHGTLDDVNGGLYLVA